MKSYQERKEKARQEAIEWQLNIMESSERYSYGALNDMYNYFYKLGKRYGLLKEFRENAII